LNVFINSPEANLFMNIPKTTIHAFRLLPGEDLREGIEQYVRAHNIRAGWVMTCVGSLTQFSLRFANQSKGALGSGHFEIVSMTGTLSINGNHIHISISDQAGHTIGGHLLAGCKVFTTAEIVIGETDAYIFTREKDGTTAWEELQIKKV
jgi:uncharacterized protein